MDLKLVILRVQFPEPESDDPFVFEELQQMLMPCFFAVELHFLDTARRMLCSVFTQPENGSTGLIVILDWQTNLCAVVDIGIPYVSTSLLDEVRPIHHFTTGVTEGQ